MRPKSVQSNRRSDAQNRSSRTALACLPHHHRRGAWDSNMCSPGCRSASSIVSGREAVPCAVREVKRKRPWKKAVRVLRWRRRSPRCMAAAVCGELRSGHRCRYACAIRGQHFCSSRWQHSLIPRQKKGVPLYGSSSPSSQPADGDGVVVVRTDLWDSYWAHFSLHAGPRIDALSARLASECTSRGAGVLTRPSRRRVLLKMGCGPAPSSADTALTPTGSACASPDAVVASQAAWQRVILFHARHFGAVEFVQTARGIHHVQFTTEQAAQYFHQWISQQRRPQLVEAVSGSGLDGDLGIASDERSVTAVLAPADERRVTPVVLLGPSIRLSTAHAQSLLTGMMGAHETRYRTGVSAFVATFNTALEAKTAVHALQFSLWNMFGVSLLMI